MFTVVLRLNGNNHFYRCESYASATIIVRLLDREYGYSNVELWVGDKKE